MITSNEVKTSDRLSLSTLTSKTMLFPCWQRDYEWKEEHINCIIDDIQTFINDIEVFKTSEIDCATIIINEHTGKEWLIADGRQRLTTYNLFLYVLKEFLPKPKADRINLMTLQTESSEDATNFDYTTIEFTTPFTGNLKSNYKTIHAWMSTLSDDAIEVVKEVLLDKVKFTICHSSDDNEAFERFININTSGKPLSMDDICGSFINAFAKKHQDCSLVKDIEKCDSEIKYYKYVMMYYRYITCNHEKETRLTIGNLKKFIATNIVANVASYNKFLNYISAYNEILNSIIGRIGSNHNLIINEMLCAKKLAGVDIDCYENLKSDVFPLLTFDLLYSLYGLPSNSDKRTYISHCYTLLKDNYRNSDTIIPYLESIIYKNHIMQRHIVDLTNYIKDIPSNKKSIESSIFATLTSLIDIYMNGSISIETNVNTFKKDDILNNAEEVAKFIKSNFVLGNTMIID